MSESDIPDQESEIDWLLSESERSSRELDNIVRVSASTLTWISNSPDCIRLSSEPIVDTDLL